MILPEYEDGCTPTIRNVYAIYADLYIAWFVIVISHRIGCCCLHQETSAADDPRLEHDRVEVSSTDPRPDTEASQAAACEISDNQIYIEMESDNRTSGQNMDDAADDDDDDDVDDEIEEVLEVAETDSEDGTRPTSSVPVSKSYFL